MRTNLIPTAMCAIASTGLIPRQGSRRRATPVLLEEATLDKGVHLVFGRADFPTRAAYDPAQIDRARAEEILHTELAARQRPAGVVVAVDGQLILGPTPDGEPLHVEELPAGGSRFTLDTSVVPLDRAYALLRQARAENGGAR